MKPRKLLERILDGSRNVRFADMCALVEAFGFSAGTCELEPPHLHPPGCSRLVNLQEVGAQAKPYQIRQFLKLVEEYNLTLEEDKA